MVRQAPWNKSNPRKKAGRKSKTLSPTEKAVAKRTAEKAGRPYPNLVDNMRAARKKAGKKKTSGKYANKKARRR